jgi:transposase InsO family protein
MKPNADQVIERLAHLFIALKRRDIHRTPEARVLIGSWRRNYNTVRPHSAWGTSRRLSRRSRLTTAICSGTNPESWYNEWGQGKW